MRLFIWIIFSLFTSLVSAEEEYSEPLPISAPEHIATLHTEHSLLIGGLVSPLSGQLCLNQTDMIVKGAQEIALNRTYIPPYLPVRTIDTKKDDEERHYFAGHLLKNYRGWTYFPHLRLIASKTDPCDIRICEPNGLTLDFRVSGSSTTLISNSYGISNAAGEIPSGHFDPRNIQISISSDKTNIVVKSPAGYTRHYLFQTIINDNGIRNLHLLHKEILPSGKVLRYNYQNKQLASIESLDPKERFIYATLRFEGQPLHNCRFIASTGPTTSYIYEEKVLAGKYTTKANKHKTEHKYKIPIPRLSTTSSPNYRFENTSYNDRFFLTHFSGKDLTFSSTPGAFAGHYRTHQLHLPVGPNDALIPAYHISYDIPIPGTKGGATTVSRHDGSYQVYRISPTLHITAIESYNKSGELLKTKQFDWDDKGWLKSVEIKGYYRKAYEYDTFGNPIVETFTGDLSGNGTIETYTITRDYSKDGWHLLLEEKKEDGPTTLYTYLPNTNLITAKTIKDGEKILLQEIHDYDDCHNVICKTIDDGIEYKVTEYIPRKEQPFLHMTEWIIEKDLKKTHLAYDQWGNVSEKKIYDCDDILIYTLRRTYNERGDLLTETNPLGQEAVYTYDARGRPETSLNFSRLLKQNRTHDTQGRLRKLAEIASDRTHTTAFDYDSDNNLIKKTDFLGNSTAYTYEPFLDKPSQTIYPPISSSEVITAAEYDSLGNKLIDINANGHETAFRYNAYGSPTTIEHPSGGIEIFRYYKNGKLKSHTDADGLSTSYTYDVLGNILTKSTPFSQESYTHSALHCLSHTDFEGCTTTLTYDKLGRKKTEEKCGRLTEWEYDPLDRIATIVRHNGENTLFIHYSYDLLDHLLEEKKTDLSGNLLFQINYTYDKDGNRDSITRSIQGKESLETFNYDSFSRLIQHIDPLDHVTKISYPDRNPFQKITTDPKQVTTIVTQDAHGNIIKKEVFNPQNFLISSQEYIYDPCSNLLEHRNHIYQGTELASTQITTHTYTPENQISSLTRAFGTPDARTTAYTYTLGNKLENKILPDSIVLHHTYHPSGYLQELTSSDGTIHHTFIYDTLGQLRHATDHVLQTSLARELDPFGNILSETFNNNYTLAKTYDAFNRPLTLQLPDGSLITYHYNPLYLCQASRDSYTHTFDNYDLFGNLVSENNGEIIHRYDLKGRHTHLQSSYFAQECTYDPCDNLSYSAINNRPNTYTYDDLSQLSSENRRNYSFDSNYNPTNASTNDLNELLSFEDATCKYDLNGNQILKNATTYTYDPLNRLLTAQNISFTYDPLGRRLSKTLKGTTENYLYDGSEEIAALNPDDSLKQLRIQGLSSSIALEIDGQTLIPYHDIQNNLRLILNSSKKLLASYDYTAFGQETTPASPLFIPWRYASKRIDPELNLLYFGQRYYDPQLGRWLTPDPAGFLDSHNLYQYTFNNPFRYMDPDGRFAIVLALAWPVIAKAAVYAVTAAAIAWGGMELHHQINHHQHLTWENTQQIIGIHSGWDLKTNTKRHTPDQEAISDLVKESGKKGVSNADADTLLEWANEYDFPNRDDRGKPHWDARDGMDHIHLGPKHVPVNN